MMKHPFSMGDRSILYGFYHKIVQRNRQFVRLPSKAEGQASLSVCIDKQNLPARLCQPYAQVGAGRRFSCAALLVGKADNVRIHPILPFFFQGIKKAAYCQAASSQSFLYTFFSHWNNAFF